MSFLFPNKTASKTGIYIWCKTLQGHTGSIEVLSATDDGKLLASGGLSGTLVWDVEKMETLRSPSSPTIRGATTALLWVKRADDPGSTLFVGTLQGYVVVWRQGAAAPDFEEAMCVRTTDPGEITGLAFDAVSNRFALCNRNGVIQVYRLDASMVIHSLYSKTIPNGSPKAIAFGATSGSKRDILIFNLYSGHVDIIRLGHVVQRWDLGKWIGDACLDSSKTAMCIGDPSLGIDVHLLQGNSHVWVKSFPIPNTKGEGIAARPRRVCFANQNAEIVGGSDHGVVYVFNRSDGRAIDELRMDPSAWVQTVAAADCNGAPTIFAAKSAVTEKGASNEIYVWRRDAGRRVAGMSCNLLAMANAITLLVTLAFLYQNVIVGQGMLRSFY
ncbi:WD40-repeat-containing domain protein [Mycena leptocephala]|nr:WD40-repeat-containing domain protein [Mycena leptocephala]